MVQDPRDAQVALMPEAALYYGLLMAKVAPDTALIPFAVAMLWSLVRLNESGDGRARERHDHRHPHGARVEETARDDPGGAEPVLHPGRHLSLGRQERAAAR